MAYNDKQWTEAQQRIASWLRTKGLTIKHAGPFGEFSLFTPSGTRIKVKCAAYGRIEYAQPQKGWKIQIHKNGELSERNVDFYIFVLGVTEELRQLGIVKPIYLVIKSPMRQKAIAISTRTLLTGKWYASFNNWKAIKEFDELRQRSPLVLSAATT